MADPSPAKLRIAQPLDAKSEKAVRRFLDKRRHAYRERRTGRASKLLLDLLRAEEAYVATLEKIGAIRDALGASVE